MITVYSALAAFYAEQPERQNSPRDDYGSHWRHRGWKLTGWQLSYLRATGEVCATCPDHCDAVLLLGRVKPAPAGDRTLPDVILGGHADRDVSGFALEWVEKRLQPCGLDCPECGQRAPRVLRDQAFCGNDQCAVFTWNPRLTAAENVEGSSRITLPGRKE